MFLFACCQIGAEKVLKQEILREFPQLRSSFSRPGFLTFKVHENEDGCSWFAALKLVRDVRSKSVFARYVGVSLGKIAFEHNPLLYDNDSFAKKIAQLLQEQRETSGFPLEKIRRVHFWSRDLRKVGESEFEPIPSLEDKELFHRLLRAMPEETLRLAPGANRYELPAQDGQWVLDCVRVDPNEFWIGFHKVIDLPSKFPGGMLLSRVPEDLISRAWLKFEEAIRWSGFPIQCASRCLDIGSAPGGGSQALLNRGAHVIGVDPAEMDPRIYGFPDFTFLRGRIGQVKRKNFRKVKFAIADMNVAPNFTLEVLEELVKHREIHIRGLLFTLKLFQWELAEEIPEYVRRIKDWGYESVQVRQLQFNRQEIMVAAGK